MEPDKSDYNDWQNVIIKEEFDASDPDVNLLDPDVLDNKEQQQSSVKFEICGKIKEEPSGVLLDEQSHILISPSGVTFHQNVDIEELPSFAADDSNRAEFKKENELLQKHLFTNERSTSFPSAKVFECNECGETFPQKSDLNKHTKTHKKEKPYECNYCSKKFTLKHHLTRHLVSHSSTKFRKQEELLAFSHSERKIFKCDECNEVFSLKINLRNHKLQGHSNEMCYKCKECDATFADPKSLNEHSQIHSNENLSENTESEEETHTSIKSLFTDPYYKSFPCDQCDEVFLLRINLKNHKIALHSSKTSYQCTKCEKSFSTERSLNIHSRSHFKEKLYQCEFCKEKFSQEETLSTHLRISCQKSNKCKECGQTFLEKTRLENHLKIHLKEIDLKKNYLYENSRYKCSSCKKSFHYKSDLIRHKKKHPLLYLCEECGTRFTFKRNLVYHLRKHSGETPDKSKK